MAKDLITFDGLTSEHKITLQRIIVLENKILTLQDVINNIQAQLDNRNNVIKQKDEQINVYSTMTEDLKKALKRERRNKKLYKIGSAIGLAFIANTMITK